MLREYGVKGLKVRVRVERHLGIRDHEVSKFCSLPCKGRAALGQ